jgi:hypothetical protein
MTAVEQEYRDRALRVIGNSLGEVLPEFYGSVRFNMQGGKPISVNIEETVRLESRKLRVQT